IGEQFQPLVVILRRLAEDPIIQRLGLEIDFTDARSVSWRLAELLPVDPETKQSLLQMQIPRERLAEIKRLVAKLQGSSR
ncbi:MAG TPA: peptidase S16, partial [Gammaproteobacteria bacterium]|nr:peptidase S16 [Gammaproteobacteria bacterium]